MKDHTVAGGGGVRLHVVEAGNPDGRAIVFIHGFSQCRLAWQRQFDSDLATVYRLVAMDMRGHGLSGKPREGYDDSRLWAHDLKAVIRALSLDHPGRTAIEHGFKEGGIFLARQPTNLAEARAWTHWLLKHGQTVSIGLVQVSTQRAADLRVSVDELFEPCTNIRAGARLLTTEYQRAAAVRGEGQEALRQALSEYNSGSPTLGLDNGYISSVERGELYAKPSPK